MAGQMQFCNSFKKSGNSTLQCLIEILVDESRYEFRDDINLEKLAIEGGVEITSELISEVCRLCGPTLKKLNLSGCSGDLCLWKVAMFCGPSLEEICLRDCNGMTLIGLRALSIHCTGLIAIDLSGCSSSVEDSALRIIASLHRLEKVELKDCMNITNDGVCELVQCCKKLKYLGLMNCIRVGNRSCHAIGKHCAHLSELNLFGCVAVADAGAVSVLNGCRYLQVFRNSNCHSMYGCWKKLEGKIILRHLSLVNCVKFNSFYRLCEFHELKQLDVSMCSSFSSSCLERIVQNCKFLDDLNLSGCALVNDSMLRILSLSKRFIHISLAQCNGVTQIGVENLIDSCIELTTLILTDSSNINHSFLRKVEPKMAFSELQLSPEGGCFVPKSNADALRLNARNVKVKASTVILIQRIYRGWQVRAGIVRRKRDAILLRRSVVLLQASYRGQHQRMDWQIYRSRHRRTMAATKIQSFWRHLVYGRRVFAELRRRNLRNVMLQLSAQRIQKLYRGFEGRATARKLMLFTKQCEKKILKEMQTRQKSVQIIQKLFRGYCSRKLCIRLKDQISRENLQFLRYEISACVLQRVARGFATRKNVLEEKFDMERKRIETLAVIKVQTLFRGSRARSIACRIKGKKHMFAATSVALNLQSLWRECKSRRWRERERALYRLKEVNVSASSTIQRYWRGFNSRAKQMQLKLEEEANICRIASAVNIQRCFRGHTGRETRALAWKLREAEKNPDYGKIHDALQTCLADLQIVRDDMSQDHKYFLLLYEENSNLEKERENMQNSNSRYWDSDLIVEGVRQRYDTEILKALLSDKMIKQRSEIMRLKQKLDGLKARERELERDCRKLRRESASFRKNVTEKFWKQRRQRSDKVLLSPDGEYTVEVNSEKVHETMLLNIWTGEATPK
mmetsp:Transcript_22962/g.35373  ORF Transcript_22962/g.35373 Transcript_22962/m.35373 type:complete len:909 (+) Transcript_22962:266-2992(+)|eukprot:CAMPEP_0196822286 /NCGR_PEP_ID=MMETSP1362-20130617/82848_1 /TAXON_ID=163516 /ORGANISM="Leptocylindrus danicus, Strain CCMP1856" /LENGTH=908 /DNA_ID=CAMNT_0042201799 /DNA_START=189 /DNA_END=2915 /DNA_ORIENTATION=+